MLSLICTVLCVNALSWRRAGDEGRPERILGGVREGPRRAERREEAGPDVSGIHHWDHQRLRAAAHGRGVLQGDASAVPEKVSFSVLTCT